MNREDEYMHTAAKALKIDAQFLYISHYLLPYIASAVFGDSERACSLVISETLAASSGFVVSISEILFANRDVGESVVQAPSTYNMAARNRPRGAFVKDDLTDAHEERNMWSQIVMDIKRLKTTHARAADVAKLQVEMEAKMGNCKFHSVPPKCVCDQDLFPSRIRSRIKRMSFRPFLLLIGLQDHLRGLCF